MQQQITMSPLAAAGIAILSLALASLSPASALDTPRSDAVAAPRRLPAAAQFLQVHNDARRAVGVAPLAWNATLELDAKRYAEQLGVTCKLTPLKWDNDRFYGRNTYWGSGFQDGAAVAGTWVYERRWYDHRANACTPGNECRSYTQVVWNTTTQLGCARRTCRGSADTVGVCRYFPPGNYAGVPPY
jgi:uncharacterized protein YkwD